MLYTVCIAMPPVGQLQNEPLPLPLPLYPVSREQKGRRRSKPNGKK